uniref:Uncharacterized protein n=1 Tax=Vitrella brassicaformis TaxID=1169539 RepID=A0A7S1K4Y5_9ALVE|mmetsp:Transcript_6426/g.18529  ORF Transcript_6426/g.18529 Transcript_6426/m.18529 type:complete len:101 (-) Transcript_6426:493-795(-)
MVIIGKNSHTIERRTPRASDEGVSPCQPPLSLPASSTALPPRTGEFRQKPNTPERDGSAVDDAGRDVIDEIKIQCLSSTPHNEIGRCTSTQPHKQTQLTS